MRFFNYDYLQFVVLSILNLRSFTLILLATLQEQEVNAAPAGAAAAAAATATAGDQSPNVEMPEGFHVNMRVSPAMLHYTGPCSSGGKTKSSKRRKRSSNAGFNLNIHKRGGELTKWRERWPNAKLR